MWKQEQQKLAGTEADSGFMSACPSSNPSQSLNHLESSAGAYQCSAMQQQQQPAVSTVNHSVHAFYEQDSDGDTQLHIAIVSNNFEAALWLINVAPNPRVLDIVNDDSQTALHLAVMSQECTIVRRLVLAGVCTNARTRSGNTALHIACNLRDFACVKALTEPVSEAEASWLINMGLQFVTSIYFDLEHRNYTGQTCLHIAASKGDIDIVRHLVNLGANMDAREGLGGETPLHLAIESNSRQVVYFLAQRHRACLNAVNYAGATPYQMAIRCKSQIANDLLLLGASPELASDSDSCSESSSDDEQENSSYIPRNVNHFSTMGQKSALVTV